MSADEVNTVVLAVYKLTDVRSGDGRARVDYPSTAAA